MAKYNFAKKDFTVNFFIARAYNACNDAMKRGIYRLLNPARFDYSLMQKRLVQLVAENKEFSLSTIAKSVLGRDISMITVGSGKRAILFVGTHHGSEWMTSWLLLRFLFDLAERLRSDGAVAGVRQRNIYKGRRLCVVPMLNPDGASLSQSGLTEDCILADRLLRMNGGSPDFTHWQANARGVDLNHNYDAGFLAYKEMEPLLGIEGGCPGRYSGLYPESEPESRAIAALVRLLPFSLILSLHSQGEEMFASRNVRDHARILCRLSDYKLSVPEGSAAYGGLSDYAGNVLGIPSVTVECGRGENPLPTSTFDAVYLRLRRALFAAPAM